MQVHTKFIEREQ